MKLAFSFALLLPVAASAQLPAAPAPVAAETVVVVLPPASIVLAKFRAAMGSKAWLAAKGATTTGIFEMPAAGLKANFELVQSAPNKMRLAVNIPGMGAIENGFDGTTGWASDPMQGPRVLSGRELDQIRDEADLRAGARDASLISEALTVADTTINGERCNMVKLTWKSGRVTHDCYSATTGLTVATRTEQQTSMGTVVVTSYISDWKKFGDVMIPTRLVQRIMGQEQIMTISDVKFGRPANDVAAPDAIKALKAATPTPAAAPTKP
jgi:hypothetical protein